MQGQTLERARAEYPKPALKFDVSQKVFVKVAVTETKLVQ
jgi:hypothetical protein